MVAHDVLLAEGPVLRRWAADLGLTRGETERLSAAIEGSREQTAMLRAMSSEIRDEDVERFAAAFFAAAERALGEARIAAVARLAVGRGAEG